jgi:hypothetical protein
MADRPILYHDGGLADAKVIEAAEGLSWRSGEHPHRDGTRQLARRARECRPDGATGIPERE